MRGRYSRPAHGLLRLPRDESVGPECAPAELPHRGAAGLAAPETWLHRNRHHARLQDQRVGGRQVNHAAAFDTGRYVSAHRYPEPNDRRNELLSLELNWGLGGAELTTAAGYSRFSEQGQRDQTDLLIHAFGIGGLLPGTYPGLSQAQAIDQSVTAADLTAGFRTFSAYTREDGREERLNWETRLVSTGAGPWRWVGGAFFNRYDSRGTSFELAPGLTAFSGITPVLDGEPVSEPVEYYSLGRQDVEERALFGEISRDLGDRWRVTAGGRWFGYRIATGNLTEFPYTPMYNSPWSDHESDDGGVLFKGSADHVLARKSRRELRSHRRAGHGPMPKHLPAPPNASVTGTLPKFVHSRRNLR